MRATYRRRRRPDPLASVEAVRDIIEQLRRALPDIIPQRDKELLQLLRAVGHAHRYRATDTRRGRPARWEREVLLKVGSQLAAILERETSTQISLSSFIDHYLRLLSFPAEVLEALSGGLINLFEAEQLARITAERLKVSGAQAKRVRSDLLAAHIQARLSGERLRRRVAELLADPPTDGPGRPLEGAGLDFEDFDPYDPTHLFWDQIKQLGFALRGISREDVLDDEIDELLRASEPIMAILARIRRRKERQATRKLVI